MKQVKISGWISVVQFCQVSSRFSTVGQLYQVGSMFSFSWLVISGRFYVLLQLVSYIRQVLCSPSFGQLYQVGSMFSFSWLFISGRFQVLFSWLVLSVRFQVLLQLFSYVSYVLGSFQFSFVRQVLGSLQLFSYVRQVLGSLQLLCFVR